MLKNKKRPLKIGYYLIFVWYFNYNTAKKVCKYALPNFLAFVGRFYVKEGNVTVIKPLPIPSMPIIFLSFSLDKQRVFYYNINVRYIIMDK